MADTKKEHYVPRCYLEHFEGTDGRIKVFDKRLIQERNQLKEEIAFENYFYDIKFDEIIKKIDSGKHQAMQDDIMRLTGVNNWDEIKKRLMDSKYIEKDFLSKIEGEYGNLLKAIIAKSYNGNDWVIKNCRPFSPDEKAYLSFFIAIQAIRTKTYREMIKQTIEKGYKALIYKQLNNSEYPIPEDSFSIKVSDDFVKLQHAQTLLDEDVSVDLAETFLDHIWVMYVNKTTLPFYTSDNPVLTIPHKKDKHRSYSGFASEGIEIVFPVTPNLLIAMYDKNIYSKYYKDLSFIALTNTDKIKYFNRVQVERSFRCIFSSTNDFEFAKQLCDRFPQICDSSNLITVI